MSGIDISCKVDSDCVLAKLSFGCSDFTSINIINSKKAIDKFNLKSDKILEGYIFDCEMPLDIDDSKAVCQENICGAVLKEGIDV